MNIEEIKAKYALLDDAATDKKMSFTSNGFANEKGPLKKDARKGLKPYEVTFFVKNPTTGALKPSGRSKMASSLEEAKRWAEREGKTYKNLVKIDVKEFKDSVDVVNDSAYGQLDKALFEIKRIISKIGNTGNKKIDALVDKIDLAVINCSRAISK